MSGDQFSIRVSSWYKLNGTTPGTPVNPVSDLLPSLIAGVGSLPGGGHPSVGALQANSPALSDNLTQFLSDTAGGTTQSRPMAFVNWVLFDNQFNYVAESSGFQQVGQDQELKKHQLLNLRVTKSGYLYIYLSNERSNVNVFFDNLRVSHARGTLLEENHYCPFGLTAAGISDVALRFDGHCNKYRYNGKELQNQEFIYESGIEQYDFNTRMYNPQIGRWNNMDALTEKMKRFSPYSYCFDNPNKFIDPDGMKPTDIIIVGNDAQRLKEFNDLQKLTSTPLVLLDNGLVVKASAAPSDGKIEHIGTPGSDFSSKKVIEKPVGTLLIDDLIKSKYTLVIGPSSDGQDRTTPDEKEDAENGVGTGATTQYNPKNTEDRSDGTMPILNEDGSVGAPAFIFLGHELIHALDYKYGRGNHIPAKVVDPDDSKNTLSEAEVRTRSKENELRKENGIGNRAIPKEKK